MIRAPVAPGGVERPDRSLEAGPGQRAFACGRASREQPAGRRPLSESTQGRPSAGRLSESDLAHAQRSLVRDMHLALLSEIGARSIFDHLARRVSNPELQAVLATLNEEGAQVVGRSKS